MNWLRADTAREDPVGRQRPSQFFGLTVQVLSVID
jgi:hypothetical protein